MFKKNSDFLVTVTPKNSLKKINLVPPRAKFRALSKNKFYVKSEFNLILQVYILHNVSIIPDCYRPFSLFISDIPSASIKPGCFWHWLFLAQFSVRRGLGALRFWKSYDVTVFEYDLSVFKSLVKNKMNEIRHIVSFKMETENDPQW